MTKLELLMVLYSLKSLLDNKLYDEAMKLIDKTIQQAEKS